MIWVINGLIYGFFTAVYMLFNQHYKVNGYVLGIWRGFGICALFLPLFLYFPWPREAYYWVLLIVQGICIGVYDSHIFFASARYGAGATSRIMSVAVLLTTFLWWLITPQKFLLLMQNEEILVTLLLILCGFSFCYWQMLQSVVSAKVAAYTFPAVLALAGMSIITKYIAIDAKNLEQGLICYLTVSTFISGVYNLLCYRFEQKKWPAGKDFFSRKMLKVGMYLILFSTMLITAKTMSLRTAPNPGYVTALLLVAPLFIYALNRHYKIADKISVEAGFAMIFFLVMLVFLVNGNFGVSE